MNDLLAMTLEAHGGAERWQKVETIVMEGRIGGGVFTLKSSIDTKPVRKILLSVHEPRIIMNDYPVKGFRGILHGHDVRIEREDDFEIVSERKNARSYFVTPPHAYRRLLRWDYLDLCYFAGYAIWNYFVTPYLFTYPNVLTEEITPLIDRKGNLFRRLRVHYPPEIPTHCPVQVYHIHPEGFIHHLEYQVDIGYWFDLKCQHFCLDYQNFDGILLPARRRVFVRNDIFFREYRKQNLKSSLAMWGDLQSLSLAYFETSGQQDQLVLHQRYQQDGTAFI